MSQMGAKASALLEALEPLAREHDIDLVDIEIVGTSKLPCVRIRIDHADHECETISLDEVAAETAWISETLDELDLFSSSFTLEVSSPGMDRPLRRTEDFQRFSGQTVALSTLSPLEGRSRWTGLLCGFDSEHDEILLEVDGQRVNIPFANLKKCHIKPDYDANKGVKK